MSPETVILRQVHPKFIQNGVVTSQAFRPTPKDKGKLSAYDGDQIGAESAWQHYANELGYDSHGVMGVLLALCASLDLSVNPDPSPFPEHVLIDFTAFERRQIEKKSKKLKAMALKRGWKYKA